MALTSVKVRRIDKISLWSVCQQSSCRGTMGQFVAERWVNRSLRHGTSLSVRSSPITMSFSGVEPSKSEDVSASHIVRRLWLGAAPLGYLIRKGEVLNPEWGVPIPIKCACIRPN
jgi:hypothetical protein